MSKIYSQPYKWNGKKYEIVVMVKGDSILTGEFIVQPLFEGKPVGGAISEKIKQTLNSSMEKGKPLFSELITVIEYNIRNNFNMGKRK
jgi:hypothetical protein